MSWLHLGARLHSDTHLQFIIHHLWSSQCTAIDESKASIAQVALKNIYLDDLISAIPGSSPWYSIISLWEYSVHSRNCTGIRVNFWKLITSLCWRLFCVYVLLSGTSVAIPIGPKCMAEGHANMMGSQEPLAEGQWWSILHQKYHSAFLHLITIHR